MATLVLTARPEAYQFESHEERELRNALADVDRSTVVTPVASLNDVLLNADTGRTFSDYAYSDVAMSQVCSLIGAGLVQLVLDISGQWRKPGEDMRFFSGAHAVDIFNRLARLRFERKMVGMQFIRDTKQKVIDGVVGVRYRYLSNSEFLERVSQAYRGTRVKFFEGSLYGRQLAIRYVFDETRPDGNPWYTLAGEHFLPGFHFANSEVGGRSVRTASLLIRTGTNYCALGPYTEGHGGRVVHSGRSFERRLNNLLSNSVNRLPLCHDVEGGARLLERSLHLEGEVRERNTRHLVTVLRRRKLTQAFAQRVVSAACARGRGDSDQLVDLMPNERRLVLESRTGYDLFISLIREARQLPLDQRETAEQVAYALLTGKIRY
jgi:hypothetical protein